MEQQITETEDTKRSKNISRLFLITGLISFSYSIFSFVTIFIQINILTIFMIVSTLFLSFLPFFLTRQYYKYKNNHSKKQIILGVISTLVVQLIILFYIPLISATIIYSSIDYSSGYPNMPCIPLPDQGIECY